MMLREYSLTENEPQMHINNMVKRDTEEIMYAVRFEPDCTQSIITENICSYISISQHHNEGYSNSDLLHI
jgi:hypothetical protein